MSSDIMRGILRIIKCQKALEGNGNNLRYHFKRHRSRVRVVTAHAMAKVKTSSMKSHHIDFPSRYSLLGCRFVVAVDVHQHLATLVQKRFAGVFGQPPRRFVIVQRIDAQETCLR